VFDTPKPTRLIEKMLQLGTKVSTTDVVLDVFAWSGTTGEAVLQLNEKDGGSRRFILVQLPEPTGAADYRTIAEMTKGRLRSAARELSVESEGKLMIDEDGKHDLGFRVFKLDSTNIRAWDPNRENLSQTLLNCVEHVKADRTEQDILFELLLKLGLELTVPIEQKTIAGKTVHSVGVGTLFVCLATAITHTEIEPLGHGIADWPRSWHR
jgi:adenine-specific DNA-methyltransferase